MLTTVLAAASCAQPALAQSAPPPHVTVDANGVDLVSGDFSFALEEGSIGAGEGAISLMRYWAQDAGWTDNWTGGLYSKTENGITTAYVSFGSTSDRFTLSGGAYVSAEGNGATLVALADGRHRYTDAAGTSTVYRSTVGYTQGPNVSCPGAAENMCSLPESVTRSNGHTYALTWYGDSFCVEYRRRLLDHSRTISP